MNGSNLQLCLVQKTFYFIKSLY